jgi:hypothetical protein
MITSSSKLNCWTIVSAAVGAASHQVMQTRQQRHSCWVRGYLLQRSEYGAYNCLMRDLGIHDADKLKNYADTYRANNRNILIQNII